MLKKINLLLLSCSIFLFSIGFAVQFMDVSEIKPGMRGIGKSVFTQTKIEDFEVEIIDVINNISPRGDLILARLSGGSFPGGLEKSGLIAGMSGSPVYIDGKLIGALSSTWSFLKEPIGGITPIKEMLEIIDIDQRSEAMPNNEDFQRTGQKNQLSHIPIPVAFSSSALNENSEFLPQIKDLFSGFGFLPIFGAGTGSDSINLELEPGAAVGVGLIQGDMRAAGIGTLTYRDKDKILAFGHPMFLGGKVEFPLIAGVIHSIMPSTALSFKVFSPTKPIGTVSQDLASGILGSIGKTPKLTPVKVAIRSSGIDTNFYYETINHKLLLPGLFRAMIINSIVAKAGIFGESTIKADMTITIQADQKRIVKFQQMVSGTGSTAEITANLTEPIALLLANQFEKVKVEDITTTINIEDGRKISRIEKLAADKEKVRPGDSLELTLVLSSYQGKQYNRKISIQIPKQTPDGKLILLAANADSTYLIELSRTPEFTPRSFIQLVERIQNFGKSNEIQISGYIPEKGVVIQAQELPNPPQFLKQVVTRTKNSLSFTQSSLILRHSLTMDNIIIGSARLNLIVER
jgi:hypothetical protein